MDEQTPIPRKGMTPVLRMAVLAGLKASVKLHLRLGGVVDALDDKGRTPLILAASRGHVEICRFLLDAGADPTHADIEGHDALRVATAKGHYAVAELIHAAMASPSEPSPIPLQMRDDPERFMAYNNGIVLVADEIRLGKTDDGAPGILWLKGMQVVNGGQTTASIYFTKKRNPEIDLRRVRVPAKIIVLKSKYGPDEEALISDISKYANSQNSVKISDLSANKPFHVEIERLALSTYCPDGVGRWFYERAAGSYNTMLAREGTTPSKLKALKEAIPPARKITKTDLAKYLHAWDCKPHHVSFGSQKNFERFMEGFKEVDGQPAVPLPNMADYKRMIAKAIIFKKVQKLVRPMFSAFQANVAAYTVAKRNGTTTLFAALNVLDGTVVGRCMQRHRHQE